MDRETINGLKNFEAVWHRVNGEGGADFCPADGREAELLDDMIKIIAAGAMACSALASRTRGSAAALLNSVAAEKRKMLSRLQAERYLVLGDTLALPRQALRQTGMLAAIRKCCADEATLRYKALAAAASPSAQFSRLCGETAAMAERHRQSLQSLLGRAMR